jgi:hypothetical protein
MLISIVNVSRGALADEEMQQVIRAINRQIDGDFEPYWSFGATLRLEGAAGVRPRRNTLPEMRGDALIYVWDKIDVEDALGYHDRNNNGIPFGIVSLNECRKAGDSWTATLSHEALELLGDPEGNLLVRGPHPGDRRRTVFHWFEMCDAVQGETYTIDGIDLSNFVLPSYFARGDAPGARNDFLGRPYEGKVLPPFGINPGGYVGFYDPDKKSDTTFAHEHDVAARAVIARKDRARLGRGWRRKHGNVGSRTRIAR